MIFYEGFDLLIPFPDKISISSEDGTTKIGKCLEGRVNALNNEE